MTPEELMQKRIKVIADYPGSQYPVGTIITLDCEAAWAILPDGTFKSGPSYPISIRPFPAIFQPIQWWEERKPEDMPEYVKVIACSALPPEYLPFYAKPEYGDRRRGVTLFGFTLPNGMTGSYVDIDHLQPATREEYEAYQSSLSPSETATTQP